MRYIIEAGKSVSGLFYVDLIENGCRIEANLVNTQDYAKELMTELKDEFPMAVIHQIGF